MVGSKACKTYGKSPISRDMQHEDPYDRGGYFIISGNKWVINMIESYPANTL